MNESTAVGRGDGGASSRGSAPGSKCGSTPTQLVDFNTLKSMGVAAVQLAVDATNVYFVFGGTLMRAPLRGGPASAMHSLATNIFQNNDPVATSTAVFFHGVAITGADEQVLRVPLDGAPATALATASGRVAGFAANDSAVYFADPRGVKSVPAAGGSVQTLTDAISGSIAIAGANLIVTATSNSATNAGAVFSVPVQGGTPRQLAAQQSSASFPMACGADVCWWTGAPPSAMGPTGPGYIARLANGSMTTISAPVFPWSLSFDGTSFFETVGCDVCSGTLVRIPASGAPATTMVPAGFAAVDDECVYFSVVLALGLPSNDDGGFPAGIYSVAKSYADPALQPDE